MCRWSSGGLGEVRGRHERVERGRRHQPGQPANGVAWIRGSRGDLRSANWFRRLPDARRVTNIRCDHTKCRSFKISNQVNERPPLHSIRPSLGEMDFSYNLRPSSEALHENKINCDAFYATVRGPRSYSPKCQPALSALALQRQYILQKTFYKPPPTQFRRASGLYQSIPPGISR